MATGVTADLTEVDKRIQVITPSLIELAENHLSSVAPELHVLIETHGPCSLDKRHPPFHSLVRAIVSQQLSYRAAQTIFRRLIELAGTPWVTPEAILSVSIEEIRNTGISYSKSSFIISLAHTVSCQGVNFREIALMHDQDVIHELTRARGIGPWTAEMFLIFGLGRPDIFPVQDAGIARGLQRVYGLDDKPEQEELVRASQAWKPYRSIASWYLWRALD